MKLFIELPETLAHQIREQHISEEEIKAVAKAALEIWLAQRESKSTESFSESAIPFVRQLIAQNRELFELLAQH